MFFFQKQNIHVIHHTGPFIIEHSKLSTCRQFLKQTGQESLDLERMVLKNLIESKI